MSVKSITPVLYSGPVHNLEVADNRSYCTPFVVHNSEGYGCEVLEAMAHGRPVICSDGAGAVDVIEGCGIRVPARDANSLATIIDIARMSPRMVEYGESARRRSEAFTWDKIRATYVDLWTQVLS